MKKSWIPRGEFFERLKAGTLPPGLQEKYSKKQKNKSARKLRRAKSCKARRTFKAGKRRTNLKDSKTPRVFTIYVKGNEMEEVEGTSQFKIEREMRKKYGTKDILIASVPQLF